MRPTVKTVHADVDKNKTEGDLGFVFIPLYPTDFAQYHKKCALPRGRAPKVGLWG